MEEFSIDYIKNLTKEVNRERNALYDIMKWERKLPLSEGDVRLVLEIAARRRKNNE